MAQRLDETLDAYLSRAGVAWDCKFFISPPDLTWSMIHTHDDRGFGGPYFIQADWLPRGSG